MQLLLKIVQTQIDQEKGLLNVKQLLYKGLTQFLTDLFKVPANKGLTWANPENQFFVDVYQTTPKIPSQINS